MIIVSNGLSKAINLLQETNENQVHNAIVPVYIIDSPNHLKDFIDEQTPNLGQRGNFVSDYDNISKSISSTTILNNIASVTFITMLILSIIVITLVVILFLISRQKEFGIYMALGEKKYKTVGQIACEICLTGLLGFMLAIASSSLLATSISDNILKNSYKESAITNTVNINEIVPYFDDTNISSDFVSSHFIIRVSPTNLILILVIGIATLLVASIAPSIYILRLNPKKILV